MITHDPWAAYDAITVTLIAGSDVISARMFGMPCLKHGDKAFAGFHHGAMVFKLRQPEHAAALALRGAHLFDPSGQGRPMKA